jgi:hypothetical protein
MKGTWWKAGLMAATLLAVPLTARADDDDWWRNDRDWRNDGRYGDYRSNGYGRGRTRTFDFGFDRGFREGQKEGQNDARRRRSFDPSRHGSWRDTDKGYRSQYGPRFQYEGGYRRGFMQGYRAAFDQYFGRNGRYGNGRYDGYDPYGRYQNGRRRY